MDLRTPERPPSDDAVEFVRFCYRRRKVGWPELYDEMCAVAGRGLYRGWGSDELSDEGIGFTLFEMPALAVLVHRVVAEEHERRLLAASAAVVRAAAAETIPEIVVDAPASMTVEPAVEQGTGAALQFAGASAGA